MQEQFPWYVQPTEEEFQQLWEEATFVFDANVLLDLYRFSRTYKGDFIDVIEKLEGRVWLPHQVAEEFMRNRALPISRQLAVLKNAEKRVAEWAEKTSSLTDLKENLEDVGNRKGPVQHEIDSLLEESSKFKESVENFESHILREIEALRKELLPARARANKSNDDTLEKLEAVFSDSIGEPFEKDKLESLYEKGEIRFAEEKPPGFSDRDDKEHDSRKYGDWILWKQILDYAEAESTSVIFVTSEIKEDWWERESGQTAGPLPNLRKEFKKETGAEFWMYRRGQFLKYANEYIGTEVSESSIKETKKEEPLLLHLNELKIEMQKKKIENKISKLKLSAKTLNRNRALKKIEELIVLFERHTDEGGWNREIGEAVIEIMEDSEFAIKSLFSAGKPAKAFKDIEELALGLETITSKWKGNIGINTNG
jgi:hypothetical protein